MAGVLIRVRCLAVLAYWGLPTEQRYSDNQFARSAAKGVVPSRNSTSPPDRAAPHAAFSATAACGQERN